MDTSIGKDERITLALLALSNNGYVSAETIYEHLCHGRLSAGPRGRVHTSVSRLRRALEPDRGRYRRDGLITSRRGGYRLQASTGQLDLLTFRERLARARAASSGAQSAAAYEEALRMWRGDILADVDLGHHPALKMIAEERTAAILQYADLAFVRGEQGQVLPYLREAATADPYDGAIHARLMLALASRGQRAAALQVFEDIRVRLRRELGVEPDPVLATARAQVLARQTQPHPRVERPASRASPAPPAAATPSRHHRHMRGAGTSGRPSMSVTSRSEPRQLPPPPPALIGRPRDLAAVLQALTVPNPPSPVIAIIDGTAGVGKSALAVEAAHHARRFFPDGELYADLGGPCPPQAKSPGEIARGFLSALGIELPRGTVTTPDAVTWYRSEAARRHVLVILDNAANSIQARPLLAAGTRNATLVTSRESLTSLGGTVHVRLGPLALADSRALLASLLDSARLDREPEQVTRLCEACAGLPLALRIAAALLQARPQWPIAAVAGRLWDEGTRLRELHYADLSFVDSLRSSHVALAQGESARDQQAARLFGKLGALHEEEISPEAAARLLRTTPHAAEAALERLADANLLDSPAPHRYRLNDLVRLFARSLLEPA